MGKKGKHEEHINMEAWVIPYADMVTLLFALFVVLYALGEIQLSKLKDVAKSVAFAFNFEGSGKTKEPGHFNEGADGDGRVLDGAKLITAQKQAMKRLLENDLPESFEEQTGNSLDIVQTDDTISFKTKLSSYFEKNRYSALRTNELTRILSDLVANYVGRTLWAKFGALAAQLGPDGAGALVRIADSLHHGYQGARSTGGAN